jgi:hypothetical protein
MLSAIQAVPPPEEHESKAGNKQLNPQPTGQDTRVTCELNLPGRQSILSDSQEAAMAGNGTTHVGKSHPNAVHRRHEPYPEGLRRLRR